MFEEEFEPNIYGVELMELQAELYEEIRQFNLSEGYIREKGEK